jgi:hypothetical protein
MTEHVERIAVLESEVQTLKENQKEILDCMHSIKDEMTRYKGFLGGVAFLISGVTVSFTLFKEWFTTHWN